MRVMSCACCVAAYVAAPRHDMCLGPLLCDLLATARRELAASRADKGAGKCAGKLSSTSQCNGGQA